MKKFIAILLLFVAGLFISNAQQSNKYVDTAKKDTVTINIIADNQKQVNSVDNLQLQLTKSVDNQNIVTQSLSDALALIGSGITTVTKEIEERNKNDSQLITDKFNYTTQDVKKIIRTERWLNLITWILCVMYVLSLLTIKNAFKLNTPQAWPVLLIQCLVWTGMSVFVFFLVYNLLTLIFNPNYYMIKELLNLYT